MIHIIHLALSFYIYVNYSQKEMEMDGYGICIIKMKEKKANIIGLILKYHTLEHMATNIPMVTKTTLVWSIILW